MKKKIVFIVKRMECSGVQKTLLNLLGCIDYERYDVEVLLLKKAGEFLNDLPDQVSVKEMILPERWRYILCGNELKIVDELMRLLREKQFLTAIMLTAVKTVNKCFRVNAAYRIGYALCRTDVSSYDIVCDYEGAAGFTTYFASRQGSTCKKVSWLHVENISNDFYTIKKAYAEFDAIVGVSKTCVENFMKAFPRIDKDRLHVIRNIVPKEEIIKKSLEPAKVNYRDIAENMIVSVGRLTDQKGFDMAIEAAHILKTKGLPFIWVIIGNGSERENLQNKIARYGLEQVVILHGYDHNPYAYIKMADLYVQPSRYEGFVTTITEALFLGKAVVATPFSGVERQVIHQKNGLIVSFDPNELAEAINSLLTNKQLLREYGAESLQMNMNDSQTLNQLDAIFGG